ncbi:MAG: AbrB/MazE/SpoVT family DNA-binding domain-containing protein [Anaerolineae bacterium]
MSWIAKVTTKGQVTLPKSVREYLQLQPGTRIRFVVRDGHLHIEPESDFLQWYGALRAEGGPADLKEVERAVRLSIAREVVRESQGG